jgi:hypothetical protein
MTFMQFLSLTALSSLPRTRVLAQLAGAISCFTTAWFIGHAALLACQLQIMLKRWPSFTVFSIVNVSTLLSSMFAPTTWRARSFSMAWCFLKTWAVFDFTLPFLL